MYKLAVFDIDGTLIDTERTGVESLVMTIRQLLGKEVSYEEAYKAFGIPSSRVAHLYGYEDAKRFGERWEENFIALSHYINPFPGVLDTLRCIKATGMATGVVTSRNRMEFDFDDYLREMVPYLDHIVCSEDTNHHKPHPEIFLKTAEALGVLPENCCVIEDSYSGIRAAFTAGMLPVMVPDLLVPDEDMHEKAAVILKNLAEVQELFNI